MVLVCEREHYIEEHKAIKLFAQKKGKLNINSLFIT